MASQIIVSTVDEMSLQEYVEMQKESFKDLFEEMGVSDSFLTPEFYQWKYNTPYGKAKIILGKKDDKMLAATMIYPLILKDGTNRITAWQNGDTATVPAARKIGLYPRCMKKAVSLVGKNEIIFGFPNKNSVRGFSFFVKTDKGVVPLLAQTSILKFSPFTSGVSKIEQFADLKIDFERLQPSEQPTIEKNCSYLDWRYTQHPINTYAKYIYTNSQNEITGYIVTRNTIIQNKNVLLVMELLGETAAIERKLLQLAMSKESQGIFVMMFTSMYSTLDALKLGFLKVPQKFVPKRQVLFASAKGDEAKLALDQPWRIQMGDWDGF